jgi:hypothetical protein
MRKELLAMMLREHGYTSVHFTRYPDEHDRDRLRREHPEFYEQMLSTRPVHRDASVTMAHRAIDKASGPAVKRNPAIRSPLHFCLLFDFIKQSGLTQEV